MRATLKDKRISSNQKKIVESMILYLLRQKENRLAKISYHVQEMMDCTGMILGRKKT